MTIDAPDTDLAEQLTEALTTELGVVRVESLRRLTGGASRETWAFDAVGADENDGTVVTPLILQRDRGGSDFGPPFEVEDRLLAAAAQAGVPIPEVVVDSSGCSTMGDARITRRIAGESLGPRIVRRPELAGARERLTHQIARACAAIHSIPTAEVDGLEYVDPIEQVRAGIDLLAIVSPAFELALRWLDEHRPADPRLGVVHGDFRLGNLLVDDGGLVAVLDWELAHLGDPVEDLGWVCVRAWRFGGDDVVGGIGDTDDLLATYADASGHEVSTEHLRWWIIAGTLRWGLICAVQAARHLDGHVRSVELAAIGRRVAENEQDLLDLLGVPRNDPEMPLPVVDHGRSSAAELLAAVRELLAGDITDTMASADAFALRVANNALGIVERELGAMPPAKLDLDEAALAARIRRGERLGQAQLAEVRAAVAARVAVANPLWSAESA